MMMIRRPSELCHARKANTIFVIFLNFTRETSPNGPNHMDKFHPGLLYKAVILFAKLRQTAQITFMD